MELEASVLMNAMIEAMSPAVEMQKLAAKPVLTPSEVATLFGIPVSTLEKMRMENRGPAYSQLSRKGKVLYSRASIDAWIALQAVQPRAI